MTIRPAVLIVIVNWNGKRDLLACLSSLSGIRYPRERHRILVIDNGSSDGSQAAVQAAFPGALLRANEKNIGYVRAVNQGIQHALTHGYDYIWIMNNDVVVDEPALELLVSEGERDRRIGVLGPAIYSVEDPGGLPHVGYRVNFWTGKLRKLRYGVDVFRDTAALSQDVDTILGCANLIRTSLFGKIGLLRPSYFLYFEETDFNIRSARAGFRVVAVRDARVWHKEAGTMNRHLFRRAYLLLRNLLLFEIANARLRQLLTFIPYYFLVHIPTFLVRGLIYAVKIRRRRLRSEPSESILPGWIKAPVRIRRKGDACPPGVDSAE